MQKEIPVLNHGFVKLVDMMGNDYSIVQAARVSTQGQAKPEDVVKDRNLLRYLMRNDHTSPLEMVELKWHIKLPIFVARQWIRHRTASVNEVSGRYSVLKNEFYIPQPEQIKTQNTINKQGSDAPFEITEANDILHDMENEQFHDAASYSGRIQKGVSKEIARINLPVSTYTEWYWKIDLKNLLHFLKLRLDPHAQWEIQQYGLAMAEIVKEKLPMVWEAFEDYQLNAVKFTRDEIRCLQGIMGLDVLKEISDNLAEQSNSLNSIIDPLMADKVERIEFKQKLKKLIYENKLPI